jgi:stage II sporulation protein D
VKWIVLDRDHDRVIGEVRAPTLEVYGSDLRLNLKPMPKQLTLVSKGQFVDLVGVMEMEDYLIGVLPSEMPSSWSLEVLKAQAVAARTFAYFRRQERRLVGLHYDVEASVMDQVFNTPLKSFGFDDAELERINRVRRAISETKGIILRDSKGRPFPAYFHADCGGKTEEADLVWGESQNLGTAQDLSCPSSPLAKWKTRISVREMSQKLRSHLKGPVNETLASLVAEGITPSGRVAKIKIGWSGGSTDQISAHEFRMKMGHDQIRSTNFSLKKENEGTYVFSGRGHGHGVGMCQWGARRLAENGQGFQEILRHYYPKAEFKTNGPQGSVAGIASM